MQNWPIFILSFLLVLITSHNLDLDEKSVFAIDTPQVTGKEESEENKDGKHKKEADRCLDNIAHQQKNISNELKKIKNLLSKNKSK
jgi:hypothetical protein